MKTRTAIELSLAVIVVTTGVLVMRRQTSSRSDAPQALAKASPTAAAGVGTRTPPRQAPTPAALANKLTTRRSTPGSHTIGGATSAAKAAGAGSAFDPRHAGMTPNRAAPDDDWDDEDDDEPIVPLDVARAALALVGLDSDAEELWVEAINDPALEAADRRGLIVDLNREGFADPGHVTIDELPLLAGRLEVVEEFGSDPMDEVNAAAFAQAYEDLLSMLAGLEEEQFEAQALEDAAAAARDPQGTAAAASDPRQSYRNRMRLTRRAR
ncbi:MAG TPA: hypothetical protein VH475_24785 [Tepidisphaeraceae bacterium]|jgi:hypothetical protein